MKYKVEHHRHNAGLYNDFSWQEAESWESAAEIIKKCGFEIEEGDEVFVYAINGESRKIVRGTAVMA